MSTLPCCINTRLVLSAVANLRGHSASGHQCSQLLVLPVTEWQPLSCRQRIDLLNKVTQVIRLWENEEQGRLPIDEARAAMPDISFVGS